MNRAAGEAADLPASGSSRPFTAPKHPRLLRQFVLGAFAAVAAGSALGLWALWRIELALGEVSPAQIQVHAQAQTYGFLVLFIAGFATFLVPRVTAGIPIRHARTAVAGMVLLLLGVALNLAGLVTPWAMVFRERALAVVTATGAMAIGGALWQPIREHRSRFAGRLPGHLQVLELALAFLAASGLLDGLGWWVSGSEGMMPPGVSWASWVLLIDGFAVGMAFGISARMFPGFLGIDPRTAYPAAGSSAYARRAGSDRLFWVSVAAWASGVMVSAVGYVTALDRLRDLGEWAFDAGAIALALRLGLARRAKDLPVDTSRDRLFAFGARTAYALLVLAGGVGAAAALADFLHPPADPIWRDVRRHLIVLGFLMTLIATMAGRLAPGYAGRPLRFRWMRGAALVAFPLAALLRGMEGLANLLGSAALLIVAASSGPAAVAGFLLLGITMVATLLAPPDRDRS